MICARVGGGDGFILIKLHCTALHNFSPKTNSERHMPMHLYAHVLHTRLSLALPFIRSVHVFLSSHWEGGGEMAHALTLLTPMPPSQKRGREAFWVKNSWVVRVIVCV